MRKLRRTVLAGTAALLATGLLTIAPAQDASAASLAGPFTTQAQCRIVQLDHALSNPVTSVGSCFKLGYSWYYSYG